MKSNSLFIFSLLTLVFYPVLPLPAADDLDGLLAQGPPPLNACAKVFMKAQQAHSLWGLLREINRINNLIVDRTGVQPEKMSVPAGDYVAFFPHRWSCSEAEKIMLYALEKLRRDQEALDRYFCPSEAQTQTVVRAARQPLPTKMQTNIGKFVYGLLCILDRIQEVNQKILNRCRPGIDTGGGKAQFSQLEMSEVIELMRQRLLLIRQEDLSLLKKIGAHGQP